MIGIIDYATGNLRSVENALMRLGTDYTIVRTPNEIASCDGVLLPGVGEARWAMEHLQLNGLDKVIPALKCPVLGICLGMQVLCRFSEEGDTPCLELFDTNLELMEPSYTNNAERIKVPHIGWNTLNSLKGPLFEGLTDGVYVYFVHSYAAALGADTIAVTIHGKPFSAALQKDNFYGCQFHPEKSGVAGARILSNFIALCQK